MKRIASSVFLTLVILLAACFAGAQERLNSLAVNGNLADAAGPYYFISQGDSVTAYGRAAPLAKALGLTLTWQENTRTLVFRQGLKAMSLETTTDIRAGLEKRTGIFTGGGLDIKSPLGIVVDGTSYVAIDPLALAFGLETGWHAGPRLVTIDIPAPPPVIATPVPVVAAAQAALPASSSPGPVRVGVHDDYARVAVDLGDVSSYKVAVSGKVLTVTFLVSGAPQATLWPDNPYIENAFYTTVDGARTLVITARHALDPAGRGYRHAVTEAGTLYFDFAPALRGEPAEQLAGQQLQQISSPPARPAVLDPVSPPASARSISEHRRVVILDPGHGGRDPGAQGYASEAELVLDVSLKVRSLLEAQGIEVLLTRDDNYHLDANKASDLAMRANMATPDRMMFVSIHANSATNAAAAGIETWVFGEPLDERNLDRAREENGGGELGRVLTEEAVKAANDPTTLILRETQLNYSSKLAHAVQANLIRATGATDRGVKQTAFYVIKNARTPSILVEVGFVSHAEEGRRLATAAYRDTVSRAIAAGIMEFINNGGTTARK